MTKTDELLRRLDEIDDEDDPKYGELPAIDIDWLGDNAVRVRFGEKTAYLPLSQLRKSGRSVYAPTWLLEREGLQ